MQVRKIQATAGGTFMVTVPKEWVEQLQLKKGDLVLLASVGAGFTVGAVLLRWGF